MLVVLTISRHTSQRLAEVGFLLILFVGVWLLVAQHPRLKTSTLRMTVTGLALALSGLLLVIAAHWGTFG